MIKAPWATWAKLWSLFPQLHNSIPNPGGFLTFVHVLKSNPMKMGQGNGVTPPLLQALCMFSWNLHRALARTLHMSLSVQALWEREKNVLLIYFLHPMHSFINVFPFSPLVILCSCHNLLKCNDWRAHPYCPPPDKSVQKGRLFMCKWKLWGIILEMEPYKRDPEMEWDPGVWRRKGGNNLYCASLA